MCDVTAREQAGWQGGKEGREGGGQLDLPACLRVSDRFRFGSVRFGTVDGVCCNSVQEERGRTTPVELEECALR